jgi:hypothetical protein
MNIPEEFSEITCREEDEYGYIQNIRRYCVYSGSQFHDLFTPITVTVIKITQKVKSNSKMKKIMTESFNMLDKRVQHMIKYY